MDEATTTQNLDSPGTERRRPPLAGEGRQVTCHEGMIFADISGRMHVHGFSLAEACGETIDVLQEALAARGLTVRTDGPPAGPGGFWCDSDHIDHVLAQPPTPAGRTIVTVMEAHRAGKVAIADGDLEWTGGAERPDPHFESLRAALHEGRGPQLQALGMLRDGKGVLRMRHSYLALYADVAESVILKAIAMAQLHLEKNDQVWQRIEGIDGHFVLGRYLTIRQARLLAEVLGHDAALGQAPFDTYFAFEPRKAEDDLGVPPTREQRLRNSERLIEISKLADS